jgi:hypothetical protein
MVSLSDYSTVFTAIATILLVIVTYFLVKATRQLTDVSKKTWIAHDRPLLRFYIKRHKTTPDIPIFDLYIKNVGKGNALDILFDIYMDNKLEPEPLHINLLSVGEERKIKQLVGSRTIDIEELMYEDINGLEYFQEVDNLPLDA